MVSSEVADALVAWLNTFPSLPSSCSKLADLADSRLLFAAVYEIDKEWFKHAKSIDTGVSWVVKCNNLRRLLKCVISYLEDRLRTKTDQYDMPDLVTIAKQEDLAKSDNELVKLVLLILVMAVQSPKAAEVVPRIQSLDSAIQATIMLAIEATMAGLVPPASAMATDSAINNMTPEQIQRLLAEKIEFEESHRALISETTQLREQLDAAQATNKELISRLTDLEAKAAKATTSSQLDIILRSEIEHLKSDLAKSEDKRHEAELLLDNHNTLVHELTKQVEELSERAVETSKLKDEIEELRHAATRLAKNETILEKYKRRLDDSTDLRRQVKTLEETNQEQLGRLSYIEAELLKAQQYRSVANEYKEQMEALETQRLRVEKEYRTLQADHRVAKERLNGLERQQERDEQHIRDLEERVREFDIGGISPGAHSGSSAIDSSRTLHQSLGGASIISPTTQSQSNAKVKQLEQETNATQASSMSDLNRKVLQLQNQLDDMTRTRDRLKQGNIDANKRVISLESEVAALRNTMGVDSTESGTEGSANKRNLTETVAQLRNRVREQEQEINKHLVMLAEARKVVKRLDQERKNEIEKHQAEKQATAAALENAYPEALESMKKELDLVRQERDTYMTMYEEQRTEMKFMASAWAHTASLNMASVNRNTMGARPGNKESTYLQQARRTLDMDLRKKTFI